MTVLPVTALPVTALPGERRPLAEPDRERVLALLVARRPFDGAPRAPVERFVAGCSLRRVETGRAVVRQGDYGDTMFVILSGSVLVRLRRPSGDDTVLAILRRGDVFGELCVLGDRPYSATVVANEACELLESRREVVGKLLKGVPLLLQHFDALYRRRAIATNVFSDALFSDLEPALLEELVLSSRMRAFAAEEVIVAEGEPAEAFFVVWTGQLRVSARIGSTERVFSYLQAGDYFGETALVHAVPRTATVTANQPSQVIEIRRDDFARLVASDPVVMERLQERVAVRLGQLESIRARPDLHAFVEDMLASGVTHATSAILIDLKTCVRCGNCAAACHDRYGNSRLVRRGKEFVLPDTQAHVLMPNSCWHCADPECMIGCPTDALRRRPSGEIAILEDRCIGCEICANQCPWGNITMASGTVADGGPLQRLYGAVRDALQTLRAVPKEAVEPPRAKAVKCDLCRGYDGKPACIAACPYDSIDLVDPNAYLQRALET